MSIANSSRLECKNHTQFETKMTKIDTLFVTTPFEAGHTLTAHRREYAGPLSLCSLREVSQINTFRSVLMCNHLALSFLE